MDENTPPSKIGRDQVAYAVNTTMRGVRARPRPGFIRRLLNIPTASAVGFKKGKFQHASFWDGTGVPQLMCVTSGRYYSISVDSWNVSDVTPASGPGWVNADKCWSVQAENYWICQDGLSAALIYNGAASRRANPANNEVPSGTVMAYTMGRLIVALPDGYSFRVGDLVFGGSGTPQLGYRDAMLRFTENNYLNEGGDFVAKVFGALSAFGPITSMIPLNMLDQQLGQGPLLVGQPNMVFTVQLPFDRTTWKNLANALQTANPLIGPLSQESCVNINGDAWYRSSDGIRSFMVARRDFGKWGNTPMSGEMEQTLTADTKFLLNHSSAVLFNNRLIDTVSPVRDPFHGVWHRGLVALDFNLVSNLRTKLNPAWEGLWTGLHVLQIVKGIVAGEDRCFIFALNGNLEIELWEMIDSYQHDNDGENIIPISWSMDLPSYDCQNSDKFKKLIGGRCVVENMSGNFSINLKYRSDQNPCWINWDTFNLCAVNEDCCTDLNTTVTQPFTIPAVGFNVSVTVASTVGLSTNYPTMTVGLYTLTLQSVDSPTTCTLVNSIVGQAGVVVSAATAMFFCGFNCSGPTTYREQQRSPINFHAPDDSFDTINGRKFCTGYEFQPRLELSGYGELKQFRIFSKDETEVIHAERTKI